MPGIVRPDEKRKNPFPLPRLNKGDACERESMEQNKSNEDDNNILDDVINEKQKSLLLLGYKTYHCLEISSKIINQNSAILNDNELSTFLSENKLWDSWKKLWRDTENILDAESREGLEEIKSNFSYINSILKTHYCVDDNEQDIEELVKACFLLGAYRYINLPPKGVKAFLQLESLLRTACNEVAGYAAAKLEKRKKHLGQETKQQQEEFKRKYITETWLKMIRDPKEKEILKNISQNKIAKRIQKRATSDLRNVKTRTGKFVLTRSRKTDKEGNPILKGLSIRTIISIMQNLPPDRFQFNPFRK